MPNESGKSNGMLLELEVAAVLVVEYMSVDSSMFDDSSVLEGSSMSGESGKSNGMTLELVEYCGE